MVASKEQLKHVLQLVVDQPHRHWDEDYLRELLGPECFGRFDGAREWIRAAHADHGQELQAAVVRPKAVDRYAHGLNLHLRTHKAQQGMVKRLQKTILRFQLRLATLEERLRDGPGEMWAEYDALGSDQVWCAPRPGNRSDTNQPHVYRQAPWEVVFPELPTPTNQALSQIVSQMV